MWASGDHAGLWTPTQWYLNEGQPVLQFTGDEFCNILSQDKNTVSSSKN